WPLAMITSSAAVGTKPQLQVPVALQLPVAREVQVAAGAWGREGGACFQGAEPGPAGPAGPADCCPLLPPPRSAVLTWTAWGLPAGSWLSWPGGLVGGGGALAVAGGGPAGLAAGAARPGWARLPNNSTTITIKLPKRVKRRMSVPSFGSN